MTVIRTVLFLIVVKNMEDSVIAASTTLAGSVTSVQQAAIMNYVTAIDVLVSLCV